MDSGIISRIKLLSTYYASELKRHDHYVPAIGKKSPDLRPHSHLEWLADELDVDIKAIMLWALRLATDRFWEVINDKSRPGVNPLEIEVRNWTSRCRIRFKADSTQAIINAVIISMLIKHHRTPGWECPEFTPEVLASGLKDFYYLMSDLSTIKLLSLMKDNWNKLDRPTTHFYEGFREILPGSLKNGADTYNTYLNEADANKTPISDVIKTIMGKVVLRDGFKISPGMSYLIEFWKRAQFNIADLKEAAENLTNEFNKICPTEYNIMMDNWDKGPCDTWLDNPDYSPTKAEFLKKAALSKDNKYLKRLTNYENRKAAS